MAELTPLVEAAIRAAVDFRYPDPSEPEPDIDLPLIQSIAADLRGRLLVRLEGRT